MNDCISTGVGSMCTILSNITRSVALDQNSSNRNCTRDRVPPTHQNNASLCVSHLCALFVTQVTRVTMKSVLSVSDAFKLMAKLTTISWELEDYENIMSARSKYAHIITKFSYIPENYALNF